MTKAFEKCELILMSLGYPFDWRTFSKTSEKNLPDKYIVYFLVDNQGKVFAEGREINCSPKIQVSFYFRDKADYVTVTNEIKNAFTANGFMRISESDLPTDELTGHNGWRITFYYYE